MRTGRAVEISVFPLFSLIQKENLGEPHAVFAGGERYISPRFAAQAEQVLQEELVEAGLGERRDYLEFVDLVSVVQRATFEYYGWVTSAKETYAVVAASYGRSAVVLVRSGETLRIERCELTKKTDELVSRLPDIPVGHGEAFSVRHDEFRAPRSRVAGSVMRRSTAARPEGIRRLDELLDARRYAVTKLYAAKRDSRGVRERSERWLTVLDLTDGGRWGLSVNQVRGEKWINAAPGAPSVLADRLAELARSIR